MTVNERELFTAYLKQSSRYAEYGSGGSTILANNMPSIKSIVSIESDNAFADTVRPYAPRSELRWINIGPISSYGHPSDESAKSSWRNYSDQDLSNPDTVLVDGRFRIACICNVLLRYPSATVLVHDFTHRSEYHPVLRFVDVIDQVDSLVVLKRKKFTFTGDIKDMYTSYVHHQN
jgi:hypothetical protein